MKKLLFIATILLLLAACSDQQDIATPALQKHLAPRTLTGGKQIDPQLDDRFLLTQPEVVSYAKTLANVEDTNPEVIWIESADFYVGYERVLQATGTTEEIMAYYDTLQVVPSKCICIVNFSNASVLIDPDRRSTQRGIVVHQGTTADPAWCKWTDLTDGVTISAPTFEDWVNSLQLSGPTQSWRENCHSLKQWTARE